ncbi:MAG: glycosyltransferase family 39 protein [Saprospiraceae bacterium]
MSNQRSLHYLILFLILLGSFLMHKPYLSLDIQGIHSWRQTQTMWNVRNYVRHDANILNPRVAELKDGMGAIYRYEFPLMQWSIAMLQKAGGEKIEIVRVSVFFIGALSVLGMFLLARLIFNNPWTALATAFLFQFSTVFFYYTLNPIPDNLSLTGVIWYLYFILRHQQTQKIRHLALASLALLIATLAKLPFLMFAVVSLHFAIRHIREHGLVWKYQLSYAGIQLLIMVPAFLWYAWVMPGWTGNPVLTGIFQSTLSKAELLKIIGYHAKVMFPQILLNPPVWPLVLLGLYAFVRKGQGQRWIWGLVFITFLYLTLQLNTITWVHDYYMMPFLPWLYLLIGYGAHLLITLPYKFRPGVIALLVICAIAPWHTSRYTDKYWSLDQTYFNKDLFIHSEALQNAAPRDAKCIIINDHTRYIFSYRIDKMGYIFHDNYLPVGWVDDLVRNKGVTYLYSDSEKINQDSAIARYVDETVLEAGSVKVFRLALPEEDE